MEGRVLAATEAFRNKWGSRVGNSIAYWYWSLGNLGGDFLRRLVSKIVLWGRTLDFWPIDMCWFVFEGRHRMERRVCLIRHGDWLLDSFEKLRLLIRGLLMDSLPGAVLMLLYKWNFWFSLQPVVGQPKRVHRDLPFRILIFEGCTLILDRRGVLEIRCGFVLGMKRGGAGRFLFRIITRWVLKLRVWDQISIRFRFSWRSLRARLWLVVRVMKCGRLRAGDGANVLV